MIFYGIIFFKFVSFFFQVLLLSFALFVLPFNPMNYGKTGGQNTGSLSASVDPYSSNIGKNFKLNFTVFSLCF